MKDLNRGSERMRGHKERAHPTRLKLLGYRCAPFARTHAQNKAVFVLAWRVATNTEIAPVLGVERG